MNTDRAKVIELLELHTRPIWQDSYDKVADNIMQLLQEARQDELSMAYVSEVLGEEYWTMRINQLKEGK